MIRKILLSLFTFYAIMVGATFSSNAGQTGNEILFVRSSFMGEKGDLWTIRTDGTSLHRLTNKGNIISGSWSPDRKYIIYGTEVDGDMGAIWLQKIDTPSQVKRLSTEKGNADPTWSPDGKQIAFVNWGKGIYNLMLADVWSLKSWILYTSKEPLSSPHWAPDSKSIAVTEGFNLAYGVIGVKLSGEKEDITQKYHSENPSWDQTGKYLAYNNYFTNNGIQKEEEKELGIWIWNRISKEKVRIVSGNLEEQPIQPVWSKDNTQIAYVVADKKGMPSIWIASRDGKKKFKLFEGGYSPSW